MDKQIELRVWELYQKGWEYKEIALELNIQEEDVEELCKRKKEMIHKDREEESREGDFEWEKKHQEELDQELEASMYAPLKKICKL